MTAGTFLDRVINAALIKAGDAANRIMATTFPMRDGHPVDMADLLAQAEADYEVYDPPLNPWQNQTCDDSGCPPAVEDVAPAAGAGFVASASPAGTGGHLVRSTSELLEDAADRLDAVARRVWGGEAPIAGFIADLRDRAAAFAAFGD